MAIWMQIDGCGGRYEVSDEGNIRNTKTLHQLTGFPNNRGYLVIQLPVAGRSRFGSRTVHSVVAITFLGQRPKGFQVNHRDGDKKNNRVDNLEWVTPVANVRHAIALGLTNNSGLRVGHPQQGELNHNARLQEEDVRRIRELLASGQSGRSLAGLFGVSPSLIHAIKTKTRWATVQ